MIKKIISGGQTGADRAGLDFAIEVGIPHGGWCPLGRRAEDGRIPAVYRLTEAKSSDYPERTRLNVQDSDATLIFSAIPLGKGSKLTVRLCELLDKPYYVVHIAPASGLATVFDGMQGPALIEWFRRMQPSILNVAGTRESKCPGIRDRVFDTLKCLLATNGEGAA